MDNQLTFPEMMDDEEDFSSGDSISNPPDAYLQRAQHPISEAMAELMRGVPKDRAIKLFILKIIADKTHALTGEGQAEWPSLEELERELQNSHIINLSGLLARMKTKGLLEVYDRPYRYGLTPAASTILAFFHLVFDFHDETGLASAIIANINLIQLRKTANASLKELRLVFRDILYQIGRLNLRLEIALQNRIRADLDEASADLEIIQAYVKPLRELADEFMRYAQNEEVDAGQIVAWLNHGRQVLNHFEKLAQSITRYYLLRASREADGQIAIDKIEAMLADYANREDGWSKIAQWGRHLDNFVGLGQISIRSLLDSYQTQFIIDQTPTLLPTPTTSVTVRSDEVYQWAEDGDAEATLLADFLQQKQATDITELVDVQSWSTTAGRICALDDALELLKERTGDSWGVAVKTSVTTFPEIAEVKQITDAEIRSWMNLERLHPSPRSRNGN